MGDVARVLVDELIAWASRTQVVDTTRPRCVVHADGYLADVGHLCDQHLQELNRWLHDVEDEVRYVDAVPNTGRQEGPGGGGAPKHTRSPVRLDAVVLTDRRHGTGWAEDEDDRRAAGPTAPVLVVLTKYADRVREARDLCPVLPRTVASERHVLTRHLDWCAHQRWIARMYRDVGTVRAALIRVNGGQDSARPLGACPTCRGPLLPGPRQVVCGSNSTHTWSGADLARLALTIRKDAP